MNIEILNGPGTPWDYGGVKRIRGEETAGAVIHICMEISQGNSLCSYLYLKLAKMSYFAIYLLSFFFYKIRGVQNRFCQGWGWHQWRGGGGRDKG
jgi:hypothetical protein